MKKIILTVLIILICVISLISCTNIISKDGNLDLGKLVDKDDKILSEMIEKLPCEEITEQQFTNAFDKSNFTNVNFIINSYYDKTTTVSNIKIDGNKTYSKSNYNNEIIESYAEYKDDKIFSYHKENDTWIVNEHPASNEEATEVVVNYITLFDISFNELTFNKNQYNATTENNGIAMEFTYKFNKNRITYLKAEIKTSGIEQRADIVFSYGKQSVKLPTVAPAPTVDYTVTEQEFYDAFESPNFENSNISISLTSILNGNKTTELYDYKIDKNKLYSENTSNDYNEEFYLEFTENETYRYIKLDDNTWNKSKYNATYSRPIDYVNEIILNNFKVDYNNLTFNNNIYTATIEENDIPINYTFKFENKQLLKLTVEAIVDGETRRYDIDFAYGNQKNIILPEASLQPEVDDYTISEKDFDQIFDSRNFENLTVKCDGYAYIDNQTVNQNANVEISNNIIFVENINSNFQAYIIFDKLNPGNLTLYSKDMDNKWEEHKNMSCGINICTTAGEHFKETILPLKVQPSEENNYEYQFFAYSDLTFDGEYYWAKMHYSDIDTILKYKFVNKKLVECEITQINTERPSEIVVTTYQIQYGNAEITLPDFNL